VILAGRRADDPLRWEKFASRWALVLWAFRWEPGDGACASGGLHSPEPAAEPPSRLGFREREESSDAADEGSVGAAEDSQWRL
jgi:hypothetical protein